MFRLLIFAAVVFTSQVQAQTIKVSVSLNPAGDFVAESDQVTGQATVKPDGTVEATNIKVPTKSLKSGISLRDKHMTEKYLEASKYPDLILKIAKGKDGKGIGILIVKGKEIKISGKYAKAQDHLRAMFTLKLSDMDIKNINYMGVGVEDEVKVDVTVPLVVAADTASAKPTAGKSAPAKPASPVAAPKTAPQQPATKPAAPKK